LKITIVYWRFKDSFIDNIYSYTAINTGLFSQNNTAYVMLNNNVNIEL